MVFRVDFVYGCKMIRRRARALQVSIDLSSTSFDGSSTIEHLHCDTDVSLVLGSPE
jgi:hypothetical protein